VTPAGDERSDIQAFPQTAHSLVDAAAAADPDVRRRANETLIRAYWRPVYGVIRLKWRATREDAEDLTQEFFLRAMDKGFFDSYDPGRGRFRTFLRTCVDRFVSNQRKAAGRLKRGGQYTFVSLDFDDAERGLPTGLGSPGDVDALFHREWVRCVFSLAVERLRDEYESEGHRQVYQVFARYDLEGPNLPEPPTYQSVADACGLPVTQVTNFLARARGDLRRHVLTCLRELCGSEEEFRSEARDLLGVAL